MCPTCKTTLDQSTSPIADRIRQFISARIAAGDTKSEIKREARRAVRAGDPRRAVEARLQPARLGAAARRPRARRGRRSALLAWRWTRGRAEPARRRPTARRSTRSSTAGSTRSSLASIGRDRLTVRSRSPSRVGFVSIVAARACCRSCPATCRPSRRSRRAASASRAWGGASRSRACPFIARASRSCSSCSAPARPRSAASSTPGRRPSSPASCWS